MTAGRFSITDPTWELTGETTLARSHNFTQCGSSFRQPSHLSQHRKTHLKEKIHRYGICGRGFTKLRGLSQHQKTHTATKAGDKYVGQKTNLALPEEKHRSATQQLCSPSRKCFGQPSYTFPGEATRTIWTLQQLRGNCFHSQNSNP